MEVRTGIKYGFQMTNTLESTKINFQFRYFTSKMGVLNYATNARRFSATPQCNDFPAIFCRSILSFKRAERTQQKNAPWLGLTPTYFLILLLLFYSEAVFTNVGEGNSALILSLSNAISRCMSPLPPLPLLVNTDSAIVIISHE